MVAPDGIGNLKVRGIDTLVVDNKTGIWELTTDLKNARMKVSSRDVLLFTNMRADVLANRDITGVLERLRQVVSLMVEKPRTWITGPFPRLHDTPRRSGEFRNIARRAEEWIQQQSTLQWSNCYKAFIEVHESHTLIDSKGLTANGFSELNRALPW